VAQPSNVTPGALARFKVEAVSFDAVDETGWFDWTGHDEVYVAIHVPDRQIATYSQIFWGVNSGERTDIPSDQNCILPIAGVSGPTTLDAGGGRSNPVDRWSCSNDGAPGPISFTVWLYEKDDCPPVWLPLLVLTLGPCRAGDPNLIPKMICLAPTRWHTPWKNY
jgi:hypothetical protein